MDCKKTESYVLDMLEHDGQRVPDEARLHLEQCSECRELSEAIVDAHQTLESVSEVLAPEKTYLTDKRLNGILEAAGKKNSKFITLPRGLKWPSAAAAAAAVLILTLYAVLSLSPDDARSSTPQRGDVVASVGQESETREPEKAPSFHLVAEFDSTVNTTADAIGTAEGNPFQDEGHRPDLLSVSSGGVSVPVRESTRVRHDNYWW